MKIKNLRTNTERDTRFDYLREETAVETASARVVRELEQRVARLTK